MPSLDFILSRTDPTIVNGQILNRNGFAVRVFRAEQYNNNFDLIDTVDSDTFQDTGLDPEKTYKYFLTKESIEKSIEIIEDNTDEDPPYYVVEAIGSATWVDSQETISFPWTSSVQVDVVNIDNLNFGKRTRGQYTK